jgi:hypothetical protein
MIVKNVKFIACTYNFIFLLLCLHYYLLLLQNENLNGLRFFKYIITYLIALVSIEFVFISIIAHCLSWVNKPKWILSRRISLQRL